MSQTNSIAAEKLVLRRIFAASPEHLFAAWTRPEALREFLAPGDMTLPEATLDVRAGGAYRFVMRKPDGELFIAKGHYREVTPPHKLVCTWTWEEDDAALEHETILTLDFVPNAKGTELVLTQERFRDDESLRRHHDGWTGILAKLETVLT
jgi:uncharacterized protein YndB with AHSA1/START domain